MTEEFLQYIWRYQLLSGKLSTTCGEEIIVIKPGVHNTDEGPDFSNARIRIGSTLWVGNVEVHTRSSDWQRHGHGENRRYDNIILHVVGEDDRPVSRTSQEIIPTLCIHNNVDLSLLATYQELRLARRWIPCETLINAAGTLKIFNMLDRVMAERMQRKSAAIANLLESLNFSWEEVTYVLVARNFGARINAQVFEWLARSLPYVLVQRCRDVRFRLEALLFGQAGMLHDHFIDTYAKQLRDEYQFLQKKYRLAPLQDHLWNFLRLRPPAFPTVRIAQLADLFHRQTSLFSQILEAGNREEMISLFDSQASDYWDNHYIFDSSSHRKIKKLGMEAVELIVVNAAVPLIFAYGQYANRQELSDHAMDLLRQLKGERNSIVRRWADLGISATDAWNSQALIELKENYCDQRKCLQCVIGKEILSHDRTQRAP
ncbi:MAG: DUF2851 family protein [Bacteroidales bacterium]|nr:DUF2851 family protein [Lentimicrobiaceae bacterium]MDD5694447.1 DUF2851 family protein [Bacteroidales bacterium]